MLDNLIGNDNIKEQITAAIKAAKARNREIPHMLFSGHPGCGKTSLAKAVAKAAGHDMLHVSPKDLINHKRVSELLRKLDHTGYDPRGNRVADIKPSIVFIDEIHNLPLVGQEILGIAMENFYIETGRPNELYWIPYFTVIGATTLAGELSKPFLDRFKLIFHFSPYTNEESLRIIDMHAKRLKAALSYEAAMEIVNRGRGVPRILVRYLERAIDEAYAVNSPIISRELVLTMFGRMGVDPHGFSQTEVGILKTLYNSDRPIGLDNLAIVTGESAKTIKDTVEPELIRKGLMVRTGSGRIITQKGRDYINEYHMKDDTFDKVAIPVGYVRK